MKITVQKKSLGRARKLSSVEYDLPHAPKTLQDVLEMLVRLEIKHYHEAQSLVHFLTAEQEESLADKGAVTFSPMAPRKTIGEAGAIDTMLLAFEDGLFKVVQGEHVYRSLDEAVTEESTNWTFIKLTFLTGR